MAGTLNDMLDRLQSSRDVQRRFVADASHELRTPIANIRLAVEVASAHPDRADWPAVAADVLQQDERMERLTADLLRLAGTEALAAAAVAAGRRRPRRARPARAGPPASPMAVGWSPDGSRRRWSPVTVASSRRC